MKKHELQQKKEKLEAGAAYIKNNYIFSTPLRTAIDPNNSRKMYVKILNKNNIPCKKFHSLRHTYATRLLEKDVPIKTVQILLGHTDISNISNVYVHVMPEQKIKAIDKINSLFNVE